jgi:hypothetical protein
MPEKEFIAMRKAPNSVSIILRCIQIGAVMGAVCGAILPILCILIVGWSDKMSNHDLRDFEGVLFLTFYYGSIFGFILGVAFGLVNGLAMALLLKRLTHGTTDPDSLRRGCLLTSISVSLLAPFLAYWQLLVYLVQIGWWAVVIAGALAAIAWFASGRFYFWYVSNVPVPLGEAPYGAEVNL